MIGAFAAGWWLWASLYNVSPQFNFILINKNQQPLKLLNGESVHFHPGDRLQILKISTNIFLNWGVRLVAPGFDVNALLYEEVSLDSLLPDRDIFNRYNFRMKVKRYNLDMGYVDLVVEPHVEDWLDRAERTIDRGRRVALLERALKFMPSDDRIRDRLIAEYMDLKLWQKAATMLEEMAKETPDRKHLYDLLQVYEGMSKTDGIISALRRLLKDDPEDLEVRLRLASLLEKAGKLKGAIKEYEKVLAGLEERDRLPIYKTLGFLYTKTKQTKKAISIYLKAVELDKKDANLYYNLSHLYEKRGQKNKADMYLEKAVSLKTEDAESRLKLAESLIKKGKLKGAERHLNAVLKKDPKSAEALLLLITIFEKRGDKENLKKVYYKVLSLNPKNETVIYNIGVLEYETGNLNKSLSHFKKFAKSHPKDAEVHGLLFDIYKRQKKEDLAFQEAQILIRLRPKEIGYYHYMVHYLQSRGNYKEMIGLLNKGLKSHPKELDLREYLIVAYLKTGKEDLAIVQMEEVLKKKPKDIKLLLQLAKLREKKGKPREALKGFEKIMAISPEHKEAKEAYIRLLLQLARAEEEQGKHDKALEAYQKILDASPGHEEAEEGYLRTRLKVLPGGE